MEMIFGRKDIAQALNFNKYPVVVSEVVHYPDKTESLKFGIVRIETGRGYSLRASLYVYGDEMKLVTSNPGTILAARYDYRDLMEDASYAQAPLLHPNSEFVMVLHNPELKRAAVLKFKTGDVDLNCSTPLVIYDNNMVNLIEILCKKEDLYYYSDKEKTDENKSN